VRRVYLVRHCKTSGQAADRPLTPEGEAQAETLADFLAPLDIERIVSSPYARAVRSIQPLAERLGRRLEIDDRLAERVLSAQPMDDWEARMRESYDAVDRALPGGETTRAAVARGAAAIEEILEGPARVSAAVSHGNLLSLLLGHYLYHAGGAAGYEAWRVMSNPDVYLLERDGSRTAVIRIWRPAGT
jgi:2,3-bisphosphoglycerate-dependent phosphoglycerate mutase